MPYITVTVKIDEDYEIDTDELLDCNINEIIDDLNLNDFSYEVEVKSCG